MTIEEKLVSILVPAAVAQLFPVVAPERVATPYTVYLVVAQSPIETQQAALVTSLRSWDIQFDSYSENYGAARAQTQAIIDALTTFQDAGFRVAFLKSRKTTWEQEAKLVHSMAEFQILEALG